MAKKYLLGLDLGTNSVGWCLTDEENKIIKKGKKRLWGVNLFKEASTNKDRRINREARRRTVRRAQRIDLLQMLFKDEIEKIDSRFFLKLNQSSLHSEDKDETIRDCNGLFKETGLNDSLFYKKYPTIYHLRDDLIHSDKKADIRLLYLACAHIIKYRGNFLQEGRNIQSYNSKDIKEILETINLCIEEIDNDIIDQEINISTPLCNEIIRISKEAKGLSQTKEQLYSALGINNKYVKNIIVPLIAGTEVSTNKIFDTDEEIDNVSKISVKQENFDENIALLSERFGDSPCFRLIIEAKKLSDIMLTIKVLGDEKYLSSAMVKRYIEHKNDLSLLKKYIKSTNKEKYFEVFRKSSSDLNNYSKYVGYTKYNGEPKINSDHCTKEEFYKYLKSVLCIDKFKKASDIDNDYLRTIYEKMSDGTYLDKQNSSENGIFPYQLNLNELLLILNNQSKYYEFLNKEDKYGSTKDKIIKLLSFKIPYYVGPLLAKKNDNPRGQYSWIVRDDKTKIYPWNFEEVVDLDATAEQFIQRMLNRCTYLKDCYCLPSKSILFQRYNVLNTINKYRINGNLISFNDKNDLLTSVFLKYKKVTKKKIIDFFKFKYGEEAKLTTSNEKEIEEINCSLSSEITFKDIFKNNYDEKLVENIIKDLTIFEDRKIVEKRLKNIYKIEDESIIKSILNLPEFTGWGRLSSELLHLKTQSINQRTGEIFDYEIIQLLRDTNYNLMEIIHKFNFEKIINEHNGEIKIEDHDLHSQIVNYVNDTYVSPGMKRSIIQALSIIEDLKKIIGAPIDEYYIECARTNKSQKGDKGRSLSRKDRLIQLYEQAIKACKDSLQKEHLTNFKAKASDEDNNKFRSERLWLYFLQLGKCAYTLETIDINLLFDNNFYQVDHIIPQSLIKDDSISNKVLVTARANESKKDKYPLNQLPFINHEASLFWKKLYQDHLMDEKKYNNLIRKEPISTDELEVFINRQLVFTNQAIKALADTLKIFEKDRNGKEPKIVYSKAENISSFRDYYDIVKSREANNLHHAHDAYLNICVGRLLSSYYNFYGEKDFIQKLRENHRSLNPERIWSDNAQKDRPPFINHIGEVIWDYRTTVNDIKKNIYERFDVLVTRRQYIDNGLLRKVSIHKANEDKGDNLIPLKSGNSTLGNAFTKTNKYGGYSDLVYGFFSLVKFKDKKDNYIISLEKIPNMFVSKKDNKHIENYLTKQKGYKNVEVIIPIVRINSVLKKDKTSIIVTGASLDSIIINNNSELFFDSKTLHVIKMIYALIEKAKSIKVKLENSTNPLLNDTFPLINNGDILVSPASNERSKARIIYSKDLITLFNAIKDKLALPIFDNISGIKSVNELLNKEDTLNLYLSLDSYKKVVVLANLLKASTATVSDLSLINGSKNSTVCTINKKSISSWKIVNQSPTGFYEKIIWKGGN